LVIILVIALFGGLWPWGHWRPRRRLDTAKLNGVNPEAYLKNTLTKIAEGHPINRIVELMPWRVASLDAAQPE
jgi:hypothetical protein